MGACKNCCYGSCLLFLLWIAILLQLALNPTEVDDDLCNELISPEMKQYHKLFKLSDDRIIEYFHLGNMQSSSYLLVIHGVMSDGSVSFRNNDIFKQLDLNVISPSIPGFGLSSPSKSINFNDSYELHSILNDANDFIQLINGLGMDKLMIGGWSAWAQYALAISSLIPDRITKLGLFVPLSMYYDKCDPFRNTLEANLRYFLGLKYVRDLMSMITANILTSSFSDNYIKPENIKQIIWNSGKRSTCKSWIGLNTMSEYVVSNWNDIDFNKVSKVNKVMIVSNLNDSINLPSMQKCLHNLIDNSVLLEIPNKTHIDVMEQTEDLLKKLLDV